MRRYLTVGCAGLSHCDATGREVSTILEWHGHAIERRAILHDEISPLLATAEIDLVVSSWPRVGHRIYPSEIEAQLTKMTFRLATRCAWGVPDYLPAELTGLADLRLEPALSRMDRQILGGQTGDCLARYCRKIICESGLDLAGYTFSMVPDAEYVDRLEQRHARRRWFVVALWHPKYLHPRFGIRMLGEPLGPADVTEKAVLTIRKDAVSLIGAGAMKDLGDLCAGDACIDLFESAGTSASLSAVRQAGDK